MQVMDTLIPVTLVIADRTYRVKVQPKDEELVRKTVKTINDKIIEYKTQFAGKDMQDYIAMVLIWLATDLKGTAQDNLEQGHIKEKLDSLEKILDNQLAGN
jgi:cell division protein ZapA